MRFALCLFGIARQEVSPLGHTIDYRKSLINYREKLLPYFLSRGTVDVYLCTNTLTQEEKTELIRDYSPVSIQCLDNLGNRYRSRNQKICTVVSSVLNRDYDAICVTRFDLIFMDSLEDVPIDLTRMNITSVLEEPKFICDNFYLFPGSMLQPFYETLRSFDGNHHYIQPTLEATLKQPIHFFKNERVRVPDLSFYKLYRFAKV